MRLLATCALLAISLTATAQTSLKKKKSFFQVDSTFTKNDDYQKPLTFYPDTYLDTEARYTDASGLSVIIQNSLPKGGPYTNPNGEKFGYAIFWTRLINEGDKPIEVTISFPANSIAPPGSYMKLFLPSDTMTLDKEILYNYGATGLESFLNTGLHEPAMLARTIDPREEILFYVGALVSAMDVRRAGFVIRERKLYYEIDGMDDEFNSVSIPCGQIVIKKTKR